jgi:hypothetical protein
MGIDLGARGPDTHPQYLSQILNGEAQSLQEAVDTFRSIDGLRPTFGNQVAVSMHITRVHCSLTQVCRAVYQTRIDFPTEFMAQKIVPAVAEPCKTIKDAITDLESLTADKQHAWHTALAIWQPERPYSGTIAYWLRSSALDIGLLDGSVGSFDIWIKAPNRAICASLNRAWRKDEPDYENFLVAVRQQLLGLRGSKLDPYIAEVLLGMRVSRGDIVLPADLENLCANDDDIWQTIVRKARGRRSDDQYERPPDVYPPGERKTGRRADALARTDCREIEGLFARSDTVEGVMKCAVIEALAREDFERVFRHVGLPRKAARFAARVAARRATLSDDPGSARIIEEHQDAILSAMRDDRFFGAIFG